ncbi:MAG: PD-(D/E)XK nuclease family protein [Gammaproteobacteria bacterium]
MPVGLERTAGNYIHLIPYDQDRFHLLTEKIIERAQNLDARSSSQIIVIIPDLLAAPRLQQCLTEQARRMDCRVPAIQINTLRGWIEQNTFIDQAVISTHAGRLMLVESLMQYPGLLGSDNPWRLADSLIELFDQLTLRQLDLPDDLEQFSRALGRAYGLGKHTLAGLGREAKIVHTLWHGWHKQLRDEGVIDAQSAYLLKLKKSLGNPRSNIQFYVAGFHELLPAELAWCRMLGKHDQLTFITQGCIGVDIVAGDLHPDAPFPALFPEDFNNYETNSCTKNLTSFINCVYALRGLPLAQRAREFSREIPASPAAERLYIFEAQGAEQEACGIELQVRRWLAEGKHNIGILTEDRRLARRVRALLERSAIVLQDASGWALSTTSAATALERWLQTVEENFAHLLLFDLLKSPFIFPRREREPYLASVYRFEQVLIQANIGSGLARYRRCLTNMAGGESSAISSLLNDLEHAALPLLSLIKGHKHKPETLLNALQESLLRLGMTQALTADAAGNAVIRQLEEMHSALAGRTMRMTWVEFRTWLRRNLESENFCPVPAGGSVQLLELAQSPLCRFDALIIAGADREHLPGRGADSPFFNASVRHELGLSSAHDLMVTRFHHFRRMLEAAPQVLITLRREQDGEAVMPSPWVELLQSFHWLAYGDRLEARALAGLLGESRTHALHPAMHDLPSAQPAPHTQLNPELMPAVLSASAYQDLINCPYQFFAARCLRLAPVEAIDETLEKSDYGMRVHRILDAFHGGIPGLPGPFPAAITAENYAAAAQSLEEISRAVFARDLDDNFLHRIWLKRWLATIPGYLSWQMKRATEWKVVACEVDAQRNDFIPGISLKGRLDRIDSNGSSLGIIDYKTGAVPRQNEVDSGEAVQLPFYALLAEGLTTTGNFSDLSNQISRVEYLRLDADKVRSGAVLEGPALQEFRQKLNAHVTLILSELRNGARLPAWGDETSCSRCSMAGLCRKQAWVLDKNAEHG